MKNRHHYPDNWYDTIRPEILKRDKYVCQHCGVRHRKCYAIEPSGKRVLILKNEMQEERAAGNKAYQIFLQVAHLDHNPNNNEHENLLSLCAGCHLNNDKSHNQVMKKAKKRS